MTPLRQHGVLDWAGWAGPTRLPLKGASGSIGHFLPGYPRFKLKNPPTHNNILPRASRCKPLGSIRLINVLNTPAGSKAVWTHPETALASICSGDSVAKTDHHHHFLKKAEKNTAPPSNSAAPVTGRARVCAILRPHLLVAPLPPKMCGHRVEPTAEPPLLIPISRENWPFFTKKGEKRPPPLVGGHNTPRRLSVHQPSSGKV